MFNDEQQKAIDSNGQNLTLSASAGSGKTSVLIQRLTKIIADESVPTPIERIVVATFTNAAANEMKIRLQQSLTELLISDPENFYIMEQESNLKNANISTISSFCFNLIRENSYKLGLEQNFRIGSENEINILNSSIIQEIIENYYLKKPDDMSFLTNCLCGKNDNSLEEILENLLKFSNNIPYFEKWTKNFNTFSLKIKDIFADMCDNDRDNVEYVDCLKHFDEDILTTEKVFLILTDMVSDIKKSIFEHKKEKNILSFDDGERLVLELFEDETYVQQLREYYKYILIDEYQDVNSLQNMIFERLSTGNNLFVVGDSKQAIYGFRGSEPKIFKETLKSSIDFDGSALPSKIYLNKNYRSGGAIIDFVNNIFEIIMQDYSSNERLYQGSETAGNVEIIEYEKKEEANFILLKVKELLKNYQPKDICILTRTRSKADFYVKELEKQGLPVNGESEISFLNSSEIAVLINLLRIIDNPLLEKPLLSVLLSPMFNFNIEEIAKIRNKEVKLYNSLLENKNEKTEYFLKTLSELRLSATRLTIEELILSIYDKTDFQSLMQTYTDYSSKKANLRLLVNYAKDFGEQGNSLRGFLQFISKSKDFKVTSAITPTNNAISCMTIHKSKGLEFPIVILADNNRKFTYEKTPYLFDKELGFGFKFHDKTSLVKYSTAAFFAIQKKYHEDVKSEEMRLLYVALTRAKEQLFVTVDRKKSTVLPENANCYGDWLRYCLDKFNCKKTEIISENFEESPTSKPKRKVEKINIKQSDLLQNFPLRVTVTELKNADTEMQTPNILQPEIILRRPKIITETDKLTGSEKGTALHIFLQYCDFRAKSADELQRVVSQNILSQKEADSINKWQLSAFWNSDLVERIRRSDSVQREKQFFVSMENFDVENYENSYLMGVIDLVFSENNSLVLVDYKTDFSNSAEELIDKYSKQLSLYKTALEKIEEKPVKDCFIYSFSLKNSINCNI
jgi:ATP-dependent helicase/nuclease subunit A